MNSEKALALLRIRPGDSLDTARSNYTSLHSKYEASQKRAGTSGLAANFTKKMEDLEEAYAYLEANPKALRGGGLGLSAILENRIVRVVLGLLLLTGLTYGGYAGYRWYQQEQFLNKGLPIFESAFLDRDEARLRESVEYFNKAIEYGSAEAKYHKGHALYIIGEKKEGIRWMSEAVNDGFSEDIRFYQTVKERLKEKN